MELLTFSPKVAAEKPIDIGRENYSCPFCNVDKLNNILYREGHKIWLLNKFRTLNDTKQTLIIESEKHNGDFSNYSKEESFQIIQLALDAWQKMKESANFENEEKRLIKIGQELNTYIL